MNYASQDQAAAYGTQNPSCPTVWQTPERCLKGVYLFGSYARGDYDNNSDVDVLIVLDAYASYWDELVRSGELASELSLEYGLTISRTIMTEEQWRTADWPVLRNIRVEGLAA